MGSSSPWKGDPRGAGGELCVDAQLPPIPAKNRAGTNEKRTRSSSAIKTNGTGKKWQGRSKRFPKDLRLLRGELMNDFSEALVKKAYTFQVFFFGKNQK